MRPVPLTTNIEVFSNYYIQVCTCPSVNGPLICPRKDHRDPVPNWGTLVKLSTREEPHRRRWRNDLKMAVSGMKKYEQLFADDARGPESHVISARQPGYVCHYQGPCLKNIDSSTMERLSPTPLSQWNTNCRPSEILGRVDSSLSANGTWTWGFTPLPLLNVRCSIVKLSIFLKRPLRL